MIYRRPAYEKKLSGFLGEYGGPFALAFVAVTLVALFFVFVSAIDFEYKRDRATERGGRIVLLHMTFNRDEMSADDRRQLATEMLWIDSRGGATDITASTDPENPADSEPARAAVRAVAETGQYFTLDSPKVDSWGVYWSFFLKYILPGYVLVLMTVIMALYAWGSSYDSYRLVDLDWKRVWPIAFVALTALPLGWILYAVSLLRWLSARKEQKFLEARRQKVIAEFADIDPEDDNYAYGIYCDLTGRLVRLNERLGLQRYADRPEYEEVFRPREGEGQAEFETQGYRFNSEPGVAFDQYVELCRQSGKRVIEKRLSDTQGALASAMEDVRGLGAEIKNRQKDVRDLRADEVRFRELLETVDEQTLELEAMEAEFAQLLKFKGVEKVRVINDQLSILVKARFSYEGAVYDLGDWELRFGAGDSLFTRELRSGVKNGYGGYPVYRLDGNTFCFGDRRGIISEHLMKGQFLEAVELAVNSIQSINEEHLHRLSDAFRTVKEEVYA